MLGYLFLIYATSKAVEGSRYGYYLFAARDDEDAASAAGVNPLLARTGAMGLSAFLTGIGGSLFAQYFQFLDPTHVISPELSFQFALLPALGGLGTAIGPVLGSFAITPLSELLRGYFGGTAAGLHLAIYGGVLVAIMVLRPQGLVPNVRRSRELQEEERTQDSWAQELADREETYATVVAGGNLGAGSTEDLE